MLSALVLDFALQFKAVGVAVLGNKQSSLHREGAC